MSLTSVNLKSRSISSSEDFKEKASYVSDLVSKAKSGDLDAFDSLTLMFRERLYGVIYNMTFNHDDTSDLTQETFVKAFRSLNKFKKSVFFYMDL